MSNPIVFSHLSESQRAKVVELYNAFVAAGSKFNTPEYQALDTFLSEANCVRVVGSCCDWRQISITEWTKYAVYKNFQID